MLGNDDGAVTVETAIATGALIAVFTTLVAGLVAVGAHLAAIDIAGAAARAYTIGVPYEPPRGTVTVTESGGRATAPAVGHADRIVGAREAIRRLTLPHAITIVTTHDFELCDLDREGVPVANAHFEEHYEGDKILFDFKIRKGRCRTTNAQYLLRMAGIMGD